MNTTPPPEPKPDRGNDPRPVIDLPRPGLSNLAIAIIGVVLAILLFAVLTNRRHQQENRVEHASAGPIDAFPSPPPLELPPEMPSEPIVTALPPVSMSIPMPATRAAPPVLPVSPPPLPLPPTIAPAPPAPPKPVRQDTPAVVFDQGAISTASASGAAGSTPGSASSSSEDDAPIRTTVIRNHSTIMPTGTIIPAVLETPIDSTRPGLVRAVISEDARGFDGKRVLIPRGSRLIGEYASDIRSGQKRVLVTWTRLIRPDGVAIRIGSPAADALGGTGIPGRVNTYFFQRFTAAVLQSALQVGVNLASRPGNGSVIVGLPSTTGGTIGQDLIPSSDLKPRIKVREGASLSIFVAHDLDFSGTPVIGGDRPS